MLRLATKSKNWLVLIIAAGILTRLLAASLLGESVTTLPGISDQESYHQLALRVMGGHGFTFGAFWWPYTQAGAPTAHWSYLYTLMLVGFYQVVGVHPLVVRLFQAILCGLLMPLLAYRLGSRVVERRVGLIAAGWLALYGYFIYYSAALMTEGFYILCVLWVLDCAVRVWDRLQSDAPGRSPFWLWLEMGIAIATTGLLRQVFLLYVPFIFLGLAVLALFPRNATVKTSFIQKLRPLFSGALVVAAVLVIVIAPITFYNYQRFGRVVLLNTNAGFAFFWANHPIYGDQFIAVLDYNDQSNPTYQDLIPVELRGLNEAALDNALMQRGLGFVVSDPVRYLRLSLSRVPIYFMFWPSSQSGLLSNLVRVGSFGLALPFILAGLGSWLRKVIGGTLDLAPGFLLLSFASIYSAIHIFSWTLIRYRLPVDAVLLIFGSQAVLLVLDWFYPKLVTRFQRPIACQQA